MSQDYITNSLCENPPCATFTDLAFSPPPLTAPSIVSGVFTWQTDCNQILSDAGCGATTNIFTFLVKVYDDFCPANAITIATMKITMLPAIAQFAPLFQCATESSAGDVSITWDHNTPIDPSTIYYIYGADNISGPYSVLASAPYPNDSYTINNIPLGINYYYMKLSSLCSNISPTSDTIMPVQLDINSTNINNTGTAEDTASLSLIHKNDSTAQIFVSYATLARESMYFSFERAGIEYNGIELNAYYPRESYNYEGLSVTPPIVLTKSINGELLQSKSLKNCIDYFINTVLRGESFEHELLKKSRMTTLAMLGKVEN